MASLSSFLRADHLVCSICQDVFNNPATIPCGHNFCITCITKHWNSSIGSPCQCPLCKKDFYLKPDQIAINREFRDIIDQLKRGESPIQPGKTPCDACVQIKRCAVKSCVDCGVTFCKMHLEPHNIVERLKKHKLIEPHVILKDYICQKHDRPLELFCRDDQTRLCLFCIKEDHKTHNIVTLEEESAERKTQVGKSKAEVQEMIQDRIKRNEEINKPVQLSRQKINKEKADCVELFTLLMHSIETCQSELLNLMEEKQKTAETQAEDLFKELEEEIAKLKLRENELEKLSHTEDHIHLLQSYPSLCSPLNSRDWSEISITTPCLSVDTVRKALTKHQESLSLSVTKVTGIELSKIKLFAVNVTMDPETAHPKLLLSLDEKQAKYEEIRQDVSNSPMRFDTCPSVLGKEGFSSGKFYFEVQVKEKTEWDLGVATESVNRKGTITLSPRNKFWALWLRNGSEYKACDYPSVSLCLRVKPQTVGVFVDYEEGLVSFYDVESRSHIYSFTGQSFNEKLYPYFCPGFINGDQNSAPLIIPPVIEN